MFLKWYCVKSFKPHLVSNVDNGPLNSSIGILRYHAQQLDIKKTGDKDDSAVLDDLVWKVFM